jgi:hypothetical protein
LLQRADSLTGPTIDDSNIKNGHCSIESNIEMLRDDSFNIPNDRRPEGNPFQITEKRITPIDRFVDKYWANNCEPLKIIVKNLDEEETLEFKERS